MRSPINILILGGSYLQMDAIQTSLELGHNVHVIDGNPKCEANKLKNIQFESIDFSNYHDVLNYCKINDIQFVFPPCNEKGNLIASKLATVIGFKYNNTEVVLSTLSKIKQREIGKKSTLVHHPTIIEYNKNIKLDNIQLPVVVKPSNSSGGRGISLVNSKLQFKKALKYAQSFNKVGDSVIIEEYIGGDQISIESISFDGNHKIIGITKENLSEPPYFIERSHQMGPEIHDKYYLLVHDSVIELLNLFKIEYGPCHIELKIFKGKVYLIEIASRSGGWRDRLMKIAGYLDFNDLIINCYTNKQFKLPNISYPTRNSLLNILLNINDLNSIIHGKENQTFNNVYFNNQGPTLNPKNLMDAYGYCYFNGEQDLSENALK